MNKVSVVILNWNGRKFLEHFLDKVIRHSLSKSYAVIVADNGSTDGSCEYIIKNHPEATLIELERNYGFAGGYNEALRSLESEYYILLNSDVEVSPGWINPVIEYMDSHPEVAACQPKILSYNDRSRFEYAGAAGGFIDKYGYPFCRGRIMNITEEDKGQYDDIKQVFWASGACMFIRSSDWRGGGGFDPDFFAHMEEIDLCWRLNAQGKKIMYVPSSTVYHVGGGSLPYDSPSKIFYNFRNNLFMLYKNLPADRLKSILFRRKCLDGIAALRFLFSLNFKAFINVIKAHIQFYGHKRELKLKREKGIKDKISYPQDLILNKSLVFNFFIKRKRTYTQLPGQ
ncbi:MAG TPA: glycosyltransferase family 2 protein [Bacteroidetes bacterium]|nr:glycosyltransferase family 2 protein [Bacteroidota bacterium]